MEIELPRRSTGRMEAIIRIKVGLRRKVLDEELRGEDRSGVGCVLDICSTGHEREDCGGMNMRLDNQDLY